MLETGRRIGGGCGGPQPGSGVGGGEQGGTVGAGAGDGGCSVIVEDSESQV